MELLPGKVYGQDVATVLADLQAVLDEHVGASAGRCTICGGPTMTSWTTELVTELTLLEATKR